MTAKNVWPKVAISAAGLGALILRKVAPNALDTTDLLLLAFAVLPWLSTVIKSVEFPGGGSIEFQEVKEAVEKATGGEVVVVPPKSLPTYLEVAKVDPNLALVGLRIEIETRMREIASRSGLKPRHPLGVLFEELRSLQVLNDPVLSGFRELVDLGNQAAHGARVESGAAEWALKFGPQILSVLDTVLEQRAPAV